MDLISLYYFSELAKNLHMTKTAEKLFISQQTLSNHIRRLEEELGMQLFKRKPQLSLTLAGELTLHFSERVIRAHERLIDELSDIEAQERGALRFGASAFRLNVCLPEILQTFLQRYPQVEVRITDAISSKLEQLVLDGQLDAALVLAGEPNPALSWRHLIEDQLYLCVSERLLIQYYGEETGALKQKSKNGAFVQDFAKLPFCLMSNRMGAKLQACFDEEGILPHAYSKSTYSQIGIAMCEKGLAVCVASQMNLMEQLPNLPPEISIFPLRSRQGLVSLPLSLVKRQDRSLPLYAKYFFDILMQYFFQIEHISLARLGQSEDEPAPQPQS